MRKLIYSEGKTLRSSEGKDLLKVTQSGDKMNVLSYLDAHGWL